LRKGGGEPVVWQPGWRRFGWIDAALIGAGAGAAGLALIVGPDRDSPRAWRNSFDEEIRAAILPDSRSTRQLVRHLSDVSLGLNLVYAYVGDAWLNAAWYRASPDVAWQLSLINTQVLALATGVQLWTANLASRERPYGRECGGAIDGSSSDCTSDYRYRSFYSGHTSFSFALASATCTHHAYLPLTPGSGGWLPCAGTLTLAAFTGVARMVGDQHYATDVLAGAVMGSAIGWFIPFLYYAGGSGGPTRVASARDGNPLPIRWAVVPQPLPGGLGFALTGAL
jgi:membrane-associated phospholipid phosphatase